MTELRVRTAAKREMVDLTARGAGIVARSGLAEGLCSVYVPHATAAIVINENDDPNVCTDVLDSLDRLADASNVVVVTAYVRRVEGAGRVAVPTSVASWIDAVARRRPVIVVAFGNPYLIGQFPSLGSYLAAYGVSDDLERAAVDALYGRAPIGGRAPISLPGVFKAGDGLRR